MDRTQYAGLRFERRRSRLRLPHVRVPARLVAMVIGLVAFIVLWQLVPPNLLFWVLLPLVGTLLWVASYGWRQVLRVIRALVDWLERLED